MIGRPTLAILAIGALLAFAHPGWAVETLGWKDLAPPSDGAKNPIQALSLEQQDDFYMILAGPNNRDPSLELNDDERKARANLKAAGIDPDAMIAELNKLREDARKRREILVTELDGKDVKIPGYVLPLEFSGTLVKQFLLVPYVGACIHVPPPPTNQIVNVQVPDGFKSKGLFAPVWVTGRITAGKSKQSLTLVDGSSDVSVGYSLQAAKVEPYKK